MIIYTSEGAVRAIVHQSDDSEVIQKISDEEYASVKFTLDNFVPFDRGDYVILYGTKYSLKKKPAPIEEHGTNKYVYTLKFESAMADLAEINFELFDSTSLLVIPAYDDKTIYCLDSVISYSSKVWRYKYTTGVAGQTPSENDYWTEILTWSATTLNLAGSFVYSSNVVYRCLKDNTGQPLKEGEFWTVVNTAPAFDFTTVLSPSNYAKMICDNMNRARSYQSWVVGYTLQADPKEQAFSNVTCLEAAGTIATLFETEFWVDMNGNNFQLNIGKRSYTTTPVISLSQGKGNGLTSITRNEITESKKVTRLIALGGEKNLYGTYRNGSKRLMLPNRYYIDSANINLDDPLEGIQVWDDIYPCMQFATDDYDPAKSYVSGNQVLYGGKSWDCISTCTGVIPVDGANWKLSEGQITTVVTTTITAATTSFKFIDSNLTFNPLDPAYIMSDGTALKVHFVTGNLAGYEFPIANFNNTTKEITISQIQDSTDSNLPTVNYSFGQYDRYVLVDLYMPQSYVVKAENRLLAKAIEYLAKYDSDQVSYSSPIDIVWATNNAVELKIGQIIRLTSTTFGLDAEYRIVSLTRNITLPYKYTVELSTAPYVPSKITKITNSIAQNSTYIQQAGLQNVMFKSKTFRGSQEAINMAFDPNGAYFTKNIKPLIVETSAVLVGTNEQQFSLSSLTFSALTNQKNYIAWTSGTIEDKYYNSPSRVWSIPSGSFSAAGGDSATYYCYVRAPRSTGTTSADIVFDSVAHKTDSDTSYWWFLIGTLGSVKDNMRQFYTSYGFTFVNGNCIRTGKIEGNGAYFDLDNGKIKGTIEFVSGENAEDLITAAQATADAAKAAANDANNYINSVLPTTISGLQSQIDGEVDSWFYAYSPTLLNLPASDWTTTTLKDRHVGDTFTNTQTFVDNMTTPDAGKSWRFVNNSGVYSWTPIADSDAVKALISAANAQDTADGKRRVFTTQPTSSDAYDVGDLWANATYGSYSNDLLKCKTAKATGAAFDISHWEKASKYTDDAAATAAQAVADAAKLTADSALSGLTNKQDAIVNGKTVIVGGYINTDLIQVDSLLAKHFATGTTGERITLNVGDDNAMKIYDSSNVMRVKLGYKSGVPAFIFYDASGNETFNLSSLGIGGALTATQSLIFNNGTYAKTIDLDADGNIVIHGNLKVTGNILGVGAITARSTGTSGGGSGTGLIQTVYGYSSLGGAFSDAVLTDTFNAYTISRLASRISTLETNPPLTYSNVVAALGFTPYSNANPTGYITASALSGYALSTHAHNLARYSLSAPSYIDSLTMSNFRTKLFGQTDVGYYLSVARWQDTVPYVGKSLSAYGTMLAWAGNDTQGFIATDYYSHNAVIGGGGGDNINWSETLLHSGNFGSYAAPLNGAGASGTWSISISGTSANATTWNGASYIGTTSSIGGVMTNLYGSGNWGISDKTAVQYWLELGSNAYTNTVYAPIANVSVPSTSIAIGNPSSNGVTYVSGFYYNSGLIVPAGGSFSGNISATGNITASGAITARTASDKYLKNIIKSVTGEDALKIIDKINFYQFKYNDIALSLYPEINKLAQYGVIAQELAPVMPGAISTIWNDYMSVNYEQLIPILGAIVKYQQEQINELKARL